MRASRSLRLYAKSLECPTSRFLGKVSAMQACARLALIAATVPGLAGEAVSLDTLDSSPQSRGRRFLHNSSFFASRGSRTPDMTRATAAIACLLVCAAHGGVVCVAAVKPGLRIPPLTASCSGSTKRRCFFSTWPSTLNPLVLRYMRVAERPFQTLVHVVAGTTRG